MSENAAQIFDFDNGISVNANLSLVLGDNSIKNLDDFAKSRKQGIKLYFDKNDDASIAICICDTLTN